MDESLKWKVDTPALLSEILNNNETAAFHIPFRILKGILTQLAKRAIELNDKELNKLMIRLALYENSHSKEVLKYLES